MVHWNRSSIAERPSRHKGRRCSRALSEVISVVWLKSLSRNVNEAKLGHLIEPRQNNASLRQNRSNDRALLHDFVRRIFEARLKPSLFENRRSYASATILSTWFDFMLLSETTSERVRVGHRLRVFNSFRERFTLFSLPQLGNASRRFQLARNEIV